MIFFFSLSLADRRARGVHMTKLSMACAPSSALTKWSYAFLLPHPPHAFLTQQALASGSQAPAASGCSTHRLHRNSINLPRLEVRLRKDLHRRLRPPLRQKAPLPGLFLLPTLANSRPGMSTSYGFSGPSRTPVGAHPYQRPPFPACKGKGPDTGKDKSQRPLPR